MVTLFVSTAPHRIELQEVMGHIATLEQAARAVHEGYLGHPLYHQAAHTAQRLLALVETMEWDEGIRRWINQAREVKDYHLLQLGIEIGG